MWRQRNPNEDYVSQLRTELERFKQKYIDEEDLSLRWDLIKMEIRGFTVKYSKNKARKRKSTETLPQNQINDLYKTAEAEPNNKQIICQIHNTNYTYKRLCNTRNKVWIDKE